MTMTRWMTTCTATPRTRGLLLPCRRKLPTGSRLAVERRRRSRGWRCAARHRRRASARSRLIHRVQRKPAKCCVPMRAARRSPRQMASRDASRSWWAAPQRPRCWASTAPFAMTCSCTRFSASSPRARAAL
eukprot:3794603-Prymnesium_polylepis.1